MRMNDASSDHTRWTNKKLISEAKKYANFESFSVGFYEGDDTTFKQGWASQTGSPEIADFVREQTRIYRASWLQPLLDEIERRFVK